MTTFILVHGALHGGWCWDKVVAAIAQRGHQAIAPDLPGMGSNRTPLDRVDLAAGAELIVDLSQHQNAPVILVAHSAGGVTISEAAERTPGRFAGLIYVTAILAADGQSLMSTMALNPRSTPIAVPTPDGVCIRCDPAIAREVFYNTSDPADADAAIARLTQQPIAPFHQPVRLTQDRFGRMPRAYVECLRDKACPIELQRRMQAALPCDPVFTMDTDHSPFLGAPEALADHLVAAAEAFRPPG